jgi:hypothetical protein
VIHCSPFLLFVVVNWLIVSSDNLLNFVAGIIFVPETTGLKPFASRQACLYSDSSYFAIYILKLVLDQTAEIA